MLKLKIQDANSWTKDVKQTNFPLMVGVQNGTDTMGTF
jgi:hypothetical protein